MLRIATESEEGCGKSRGRHVGTTSSASSPSSLLSPSTMLVRDDARRQLLNYIGNDTSSKGLGYIVDSDKTMLMIPTNGLPTTAGISTKNNDILYKAGGDNSDSPRLPLYRSIQWGWDDNDDSIATSMNDFGDGGHGRVVVDPTTNASAVAAAQAAADTAFAATTTGLYYDSAASYISTSSSSSSRSPPIVSASTSCSSSMNRHGCGGDGRGRGAAGSVQNGQHASSLERPPQQGEEQQQQQQQQQQQELDGMDTRSLDHATFPWDAYPNKEWIEEMTTTTSTEDDFANFYDSRGDGSAAGDAAPTPATSSSSSRQHVPSNDKGTMMMTPKMSTSMTTSPSIITTEQLLMLEPTPIHSDVSQMEIVEEYVPPPPVERLLHDYISAIGNGINIIGGGDHGAAGTSPSSMANGTSFAAMRQPSLLTSMENDIQDRQQQEAARRASIINKIDARRSLRSISGGVLARSRVVSDCSSAQFGTVGRHQEIVHEEAPPSVVSAMSSPPPSSLSSEAGSICNDNDYKVAVGVAWYARYKELVQYKSLYGDCCVPYNYKANLPLAQWVKRQRYQYKLRSIGKHNNLNDERFDLLESLGFVWDGQEANWNETYNLLKEYKDKYGHCRISTTADSLSSSPSSKDDIDGDIDGDINDDMFDLDDSQSGSTNGTATGGGGSSDSTVDDLKTRRRLSVWVKLQRRQYRLHIAGKDSYMTKDRIDKLNELDFIWEPRQGK